MSGLQGCQAYDETGNICNEPGSAFTTIWKGNDLICKKHLQVHREKKNLRPVGCEECDHFGISSYYQVYGCHKYLHAGSKEVSFGQIMNLEDLKDDMPFIRPPMWCPLLQDAGVTFDEVIS